MFHNFVYYEDSESEMTKLVRNRALKYRRIAGPPVIVFGVAIIIAIESICFSNQIVVAQSNCDSFIPVQIGQKWGFIDLKGKMVLPPLFDFAENFESGRALVENDGIWGIIDEQGKWIL